MHLSISSIVNTLGISQSMSKINRNFFEYYVTLKLKSNLETYLVFGIFPFHSYKFLYLVTRDLEYVPVLKFHLNFSGLFN